MAYKIEGTKITTVRGDTFRVMVNITNNDGTPYTPAEGDSIRFALKSTKMNAAKSEYEDRVPLIRKTIPVDTLVLELEPNDTKSLGFGAYEYDIEITKEDGDVDTFIQASPFILAKELD